MKLAQYLKDEKISANQFAGRLGVPASTVTRWINNERMPTARHIEAVQRETRDSVRFEDWMRPNKAKRKTKASV